MRLILRDERYTGTNIFGKRMRDEVGKAHTVKNRQEDWISVEGTHEGIVTRIEYEIKGIRETLFSNDITFYIMILDRIADKSACGLSHKMLLNQMMQEKRKIKKFQKTCKIF